MQQLTEEQLLAAPSGHSNSIAVIVNHLRGNMLSRWTNFLKEDGEKAWRQRDREFTAELSSASEVEHAWKEGWDCLFAALSPIQSSQLSQIVYIRNEGHTVLEAINRQLTHYSYHLGQIVFLAKHWRGEDWQYLSIPPGGSGGYNQQKFDRDRDRWHFV